MCRGDIWKEAVGRAQENSLVSVSSVDTRGPQGTHEDRETQTHLQHPHPCILQEMKKLSH